ncbi:MAG: hypothetical protein RL234_876, partial [Pseudomonadota bacterium]
MLDFNWGLIYFHSVVDGCVANKLREKIATKNVC